MNDMAEHFVALAGVAAMTLALWLYENVFLGG